MTDLELAEEIETSRLSFRKMVRKGEQIERDLTDAEEEQIIAALRRGHDLRQKMRYIFKQYGTGDGSPGWIEHTDQDGKLCRDALSFEGELIFDIEALLERPPSGEMAMVPKLETEAMQDAVRGILQAIRCNPGVTEDQVYQHCKLRGDSTKGLHENDGSYVTEARAAAMIYRAMLSAAEAERRKG